MIGSDAWKVYTGRERSVPDEKRIYLSGCSGSAFHLRFRLRAVRFFGNGMDRKAHCPLRHCGGGTRNRTQFHQQINALSLDYLLQKKGGTVEEYMEYSVQQVLPFAPEEEQRVSDAMEWLNQLLESHGLKLPDSFCFTYTTSSSLRIISQYFKMENRFSS